MSGAMATTAITCSASTFADAVNDIDDDFDANKTEEENEAEREASSSSENVSGDNADTADDGVANEVSATGETVWYLMVLPKPKHQMKIQQMKNQKMNRSRQ